MLAKHLVLLLAVGLASTQASPVSDPSMDKRIVLQKGMRPIKTPSGIHILRREGDMGESENEGYEKRYRLLPGMQPVETPGEAVSLKRFILEPGMQPIDTPGDTVAHKRYVLLPGMEPLESLPGNAVSHKRSEEAKGPLRLQVEPATFTGRRPGRAARRDDHHEQGEERKRSMPLEIDPIDGETAYQNGLEGQHIQMADSATQKRADEMMVGLKTSGPRVILP